jgi:hypothetical protein
MKSNNTIYDIDGKFIKHHVTKENPCSICDARKDNCHTNYCPNFSLKPDYCIKCGHLNEAHIEKNDNLFFCLHCDCEHKPMKVIK